MVPVPSPISHPQGPVRHKPRTEAAKGAQPALQAAHGSQRPGFAIASHLSDAAKTWKQSWWFKFLCFSYLPRSKVRGMGYKLALDTCGVQVSSRPMGGQFGRCGRSAGLNAPNNLHSQHIGNSRMRNSPPSDMQQTTLRLDPYNFTTENAPPG